MAARLIGSPDIYAQGARDPERSINFVTCHDGFTLNDLVSYNDSTTGRTAKTDATDRTKI
jgi:glycogen operon protein